MKQKKIMSVLEIKQADFESALNRCLDADKPDERDLELIKTVVGADIVNLLNSREKWLYLEGLSTGYELGTGTHPTAIWWIREEAQNDQRTATLSPDRQTLEIVFYDGDEAVEYLTITYEGGGLCVASSVRVEGSK